MSVTSPSPVLPPRDLKIEGKALGEWAQCPSFLGQEGRQGLRRLGQTREKSGDLLGQNRSKREDEQAILGPDGQESDLVLA